MSTTARTTIALTNRAWAEMLLLSLIWGGSFMALRIALGEIGVLTSVAFRTGIAAIVLWGVVLAMRLPLPRDPRTWAAFLAMGLLNNMIPFGLISWGQLHIETGLTSILNASTAFFGVLVAAFFFSDEHLSARRLAGVVIGMAGVALAVGVEALRALDLRSLAQLAVLGATVSYALAGAFARANLSHLPPQMAAAGMLTGASLVSVPLAWMVEGPLPFDLMPQTWAAIAYYALFATAGAFLLYYRILAMAGSGNLMLVTMLVMPVAIVLGAVFLGETLHPSAYGGFALIALGMITLDGRLFRRFTR